MSLDSAQGAAAPEITIDSAYAPGAIRGDPSGSGRLATSRQVTMPEVKRDCLGIDDGNASLSQGDCRLIRPEPFGDGTTMR
jgi:hypothetical protein